MRHWLRSLDRICSTIDSSQEWAFVVALGAECGTVRTINSGPVGRITIDLAQLAATCSSAGQLCLYQNVAVAANVDRLCCKSMLSLNLRICRSAPHMINA